VLERLIAHGSEGHEGDEFHMDLTSRRTITMRLSNDSDDVWMRQFHQAGHFREQFLSSLGEPTVRQGSSLPSLPINVQGGDTEPTDPDLVVSTHGNSADAISSDQ
jgi:hypothetical protein